MRSYYFTRWHAYIVLHTRFTGVHSEHQHGPRPGRGHSCNFSVVGRLYISLRANQTILTKNLTMFRRKPVCQYRAVDLFQVRRMQFGLRSVGSLDPYQQSFCRMRQRHGNTLLFGPAQAGPCHKAVGTCTCLCCYLNIRAHAARCPFPGTSAS